MEEKKNFSLFIAFKLMIIAWAENRNDSGETEKNHVKRKLAINFYWLFLNNFK